MYPRADSLHVALFGTLRHHDGTREPASVLRQPAGQNSSELLTMAPLLSREPWPRPIHVQRRVKCDEPRLGLHGIQRRLCALAEGDLGVRQPNGLELDEQVRPLGRPPNAEVRVATVLTSRLEQEVGTVREDVRDPVRGAQFRPRRPYVDVVAELCDEL